MSSNAFPKLSKRLAQHVCFFVSMDIQYGDVFYLNSYILGYVLALLSCILSSFPLLSNTCTYSYISNFCKESLFNRFVCKLYT